MDRIDVETVSRRLLALFTLSFVVLGGVGAIGPVVAPGTTAVTERYTQSPPTTCIDSAQPPTAEDRGTGNVSGTVHRLDNGTIEIGYTGTPATEFSVTAPSGLNIVATKGFDTADNTMLLGGPTGPTWNRTATEHWIRFRSGSRYPGGPDWQLAPVPDHGRGNVTLHTAETGYIGPHVLYLGAYTQQSISAGCQNITAIVPEKAVTWLDVEQRLVDLRFAAMSLESGHTYERVRVFVTPKRPSSEKQSIGGFRLRDASTVVVHDYNPVRPSAVTWLHEYIHTHQALRERPSATWTHEAIPTYLSIRLAVESGRISPRKYDAWLARGSGDSQVSLTSAPGGANVTYYRGAVLLASIETETWQHGRTTVGDLLGYLNAERNPGQAAIELFLRDSGGLSDATTAELHDQATGTMSICPPYLLGPSWLSPSWRRGIGHVAAAHTAPLYFVFAGVLGSMLALERTSYLDRVGGYMRERLR
jgi:hypothetical protein